MAIDTLNIDGLMRLGIYVADSVTGGLQRRTFGAKGLPQLIFGLTYGSGDKEANKIYFAKRTLATVTFDNLDLYGGLTDFEGNAINMAFLKLALIALAVPAAGVSLRVGPQNQTHAIQAGWGGVGATVYNTVTNWDAPVWEPLTGYAVTNGSSDVFPVYNPTASPIDYYILLAGV